MPIFSSVRRTGNADSSTSRMISSFSEAEYLMRHPPHPPSRFFEQTIFEVSSATTSFSALASRRRSLTSSEVAARAVSPASRARAELSEQRLADLSEQRLAISRKHWPICGSSGTGGKRPQPTGKTVAERLTLPSPKKPMTWWRWLCGSKFCRDLPAEARSIAAGRPYQFRAIDVRALGVFCCLKSVISSPARRRRTQTALICVILTRYEPSRDCRRCVIVLPNVRLAGKSRSLLRPSG